MNPLKSLYAAWYDRFAAYLIDAVILLFPAAIAVALISDTNADGTLAVSPASVPVVFLIQMAYFVKFLSGHAQATPGMRLAGIHLIRLDGRALTQRDGLERFLAFIIPSLPMNITLLPLPVCNAISLCLAALWFYPIIITGIGMHDRLCNMRVIKGRL